MKGRKENKIHYNNHSVKFQEILEIMTFFSYLPFWVLTISPIPLEHCNSFHKQMENVWWVCDIV